MRCHSEITQARSDRPEAESTGDAGSKPAARPGPASEARAEVSALAGAMREVRAGLMVTRGEIAVTFEFARRLLVVDRENGCEIGRFRRALDRVSPASRVALLTELGVEVLVCGAISRPVWALVSAAGIRVIPLVKGSSKDVLAGLFEDRIEDPCFLFPGCSLEDRARLLARRGAAPLCLVKPRQ